MSNVVEFPSESAVTTEHYFGGCPHCGDQDGFLNDGPDHWFVCDRHKTKWYVGSNLFSSWQDEDEETRKHNRFKLSEYMTAKPVLPGEHCEPMKS